jgi:hypothetical protein
VVLLGGLLVVLTGVLLGVLLGALVAVLAGALPGVLLGVLLAALPGALLVVLPVVFAVLPAVLGVFVFFSPAMPPSPILFYNNITYKHCVQCRKFEVLSIPFWDKTNFH